MKIVGIAANGDKVELHNVQTLYIDGRPYVPPAPEPVQRWVLGVSFAGGAGWCHASDMDQGPNVKARAKLAFDDTGRVWMADNDSQRLARELRKYADPESVSVTDSFAALMREAAERLAGPAGPEPDAGGAK